MSLSIQFYYPKRFSFSPLDYESGVGGTEASIILLSDALAKNGHNVEVFNACWRPAVYGDVRWRGAWDIEKASIPDVFVCVRTASSVILKPAKMHLFWMLDDRTDGVLAFQTMYPYGIVILASEVMRQRALLAGYKGRIAKIFLPVDTERIVNDGKPSSSKIILHSSMPSRGLKQLLHMWPSVHKVVPSAQLYITSGWELWGYTKEEAKDKWNQVIGSDSIGDSVNFTGVLPKSHLFELLKRARFSVIPSSFPEMFCIAAAETEMAGRPLIVSDYEALGERVEDNENGFKIRGNIDDEKVQDEFISKMISLLCDDLLVDEMGEKSRIRGLRYDSHRIALEWINLICSFRI